MPANNTRSNNTSKSSNSKMGMGLTKDNLTWLGIILLVIVVIIVLYYMQKKRAEGFESQMRLNNMVNDSPKKASNAIIAATSITPQSGECVVALFYADWCGHCKKFKPEFETAMKQLNGQLNKKGKKLRLVKVDCDAEKELAKKYDISGYPTVKILEDNGTIAEYGGERSFEGLRKYLVSDD